MHKRFSFKSVAAKSVESRVFDCCYYRVFDIYLPSKKNIYWKAISFCDVLVETIVEFVTIDKFDLSCAHTLHLDNAVDCRV